MLSMTKQPMTGLPIGNWSNIAAEKGAEINLDKAKKAPKPKTTTHFHFSHKKLGLPANPGVQVVAPVPEEDAGKEEATPQPSEDSDSGESYEAQQDDLSVSPGDVKVAIRVVHASKQSQVNALGVIRWDIGSTIRNVKCTILSF